MEEKKMAMANPYNYSKPKMAQTVAVKKPIRSAQRPTSQSDSYLEQKVLVAKPEELTLMLFEGLVKFLKKATLFNKEKNVEKTHQMIMRAEAIITELRSTLDMKFEVAKQLESMYEYMTHRLFEANLNKDSEILEEVQGYAQELKDTWEEAMKNMR